jgi:hypothetical protein
LRLGLDVRHFRLPASLILTLASLMAAVAQTRSPFGLGPPVPREAPPTGLVAWLLEQQAAFHKALTAAIGAVETSPSAMVTLIGLAFAYGVIHAIGPGHGKAVIASYLVANERALKRGIALSFGAAGVQALVALRADERHRCLHEQRRRHRREGGFRAYRRDGVLDRLAQNPRADLRRA